MIRDAVRHLFEQRGGLKFFMRTARAALLLLVLLPAELAPTGCGCDLEITNGALAQGTVGVSYAFDLHSQCGGDAWFLESGTLPPGIGLLNDGDLRGVPTIAGVFAFSVGVIDFSSGDQAFKGFAITVNPAPEPTPM